MALRNLRPQGRRLRVGEDLSGEVIARAQLWLNPESIAPYPDKPLAPAGWDDVGTYGTNYNSNVAVKDSGQIVGERGGRYISLNTGNSGDQHDIMQSRFWSRFFPNRDWTFHFIVRNISNTEDLSEFFQIASAESGGASRIYFRQTNDGDFAVTTDGAGGFTTDTHPIGTGWRSVTVTRDAANLRIYEAGILRSTSAGAPRSDVDLFAAGTPWAGLGNNTNGNGRMGYQHVVMFPEALPDADVLSLHQFLAARSDLVV